MKKYAVVGFAISMSLAASPALALDLVDIINPPQAINTPYSLAFTANTGITTISFAGYQLPDQIRVTGIGLFANNAGPNLLGLNWAYTPAPVPVGGGGFQFADGAVNGLILGNTVIGSYDVFSQAIGTTGGASYTLTFLFSNNANSPPGGNLDGPAGFRVSASDSRLSGAVPEPASWAMMIVGFGLTGTKLRSRRNVTTRVACG